MKADISKMRDPNANIGKIRDKELIYSLQAVVKKDSKYGKLALAIVDARFYQGRSPSASNVYCILWIRTKDGNFVTTRGEADGGNYERQSAALSSALYYAGIELDERISGAGKEAMIDAVDALSKAVFDGEYLITEAFA